MFARKSLSLGLLVLLLPVHSCYGIIDVTLQMQLGNPSGATADTNNHDHYLILRSVEAVDYSDNLGEPHWASWDLTAADLGSSERTGSFFLDTSLPADFSWIRSDDYTHSGYDRGHLCPSADRTDNTNDNKLVFLMSNVMPQTSDNNQGPWERLEAYCRALAQTNELLIICGPNCFSGSRINTNGPVLIPNYTWKIVVVVPPGDGMAVSRITVSNRVIAVNIPNVSGIRSVSWTNYLTSVNVIQTNTGFTFFTALPDEVATLLRDRVDGTPAPEPRPPLRVAFSGANLVVSWPSSCSAGFSLQQNSGFNPTNWIAFNGDLVDNGVTKNATVALPSEGLFFRLIRP